MLLLTCPLMAVEDELLRPLYLQASLALLSLSSAQNGKGFPLLVVLSGGQGFTVNHWLSLTQPQFL